MSVAKFTITATLTAAEVEAAISNNTEMTAQEKAAILTAINRTRAFDWKAWFEANPQGLTLTGADVLTLEGKDADGKKKTFAAMAITTSAGKDAVIYLTSLFKCKVDKDGVAHRPSGEMVSWAVGPTDLDKAQAILAAAKGKVLYPREDRFIRAGKFGDYEDCVRSWTTIKPE